MKNKKLLSFLAVTLSAVAFSGCTSGSKTVEFKNYWLKDSLATSVEQYEETLVYNVTFKKDSGLDSMSYNLDYQNGSYTTTLKHYSDGKCELTTKLTVDVVYALEGEDPVIPVIKQDVAETYVLFYRAQDALKPIKSTKTLHSHMPLNVTKSVSSAEDCFLETWYSMNTDYADGKGVCVYQDLIPVNENSGELAEPKTYNFSMSEKYSYLDNEQLLVGLRAMSTSTTSATVKTFSPFVKALQQVSVSFNSKEESATIDVTENGTAISQKPFTYRIAEMVIKAQNPGATQTVWIANEKNRNVMLHLETPLSFGIGSLVYDLTSIDRAE